MEASPAACACSRKDISSSRADPADVRLIDIYSAIEGKIEVRKCDRKDKICPVDKCIFDNITSKMTEEFIKHMENECLKDYL